MILGRIVTDDQTLNISDYIEIVPYEKYKNDGTISLIIGKDEVTKLFPDVNLKYLNRNIDVNTFWTFSKFEKRNIYENDVKKFKEYIFNSVFNKVKYKTLDIVYSKYNSIKKCINCLYNNRHKYVYICDNAIYIYYFDTLYGISLDECKYVGISVERILRLLRQGNNVHIIFSDNFIGNKDNMLKIEPKYIPYLYFLSNN